jgi:hypothetical protein
MPVHVHVHVRNIAVPLRRPRGEARPPAPRSPAPRSPAPRSPAPRSPAPLPPPTPPPPPSSARPARAPCACRAPPRTCSSSALYSSRPSSGSQESCASSNPSQLTRNSQSPGEPPRTALMAATWKVVTASHAAALDLVPRPRPRPRPLAAEEEEEAAARPPRPRPRPRPRRGLGVAYDCFCSGSVATGGQIWRRDRLLPSTSSNTCRPGLRGCEASKR